MTSILLTTINAQYIHASLGLRYLLANLGELRTQTRLLEFTLDHRPIDIVEQLLAHNPKIIALGVYIWNIQASTEVVTLLKQAPLDRQNKIFKEFKTPEEAERLHDILEKIRRGDKEELINQTRDQLNNSAARNDKANVK